MADSFVQWMPITIKQLMNSYPFKLTANFQEHFRVRGHTCLCFCFLGFNECLNYNGHCQQICNDTKTSYFCSCRPGYEVDKEDPKGCQGK